MQTPLVTMKGITKRYGSVMANDGVDFDLQPGEVHALLGENGSGKTTLMSILYGLIRPDGGEIRINNVVQQWRGPQDALANGIAMIPQQFRLVPTLTAVENVVMGQSLRGRYGNQLREVKRQLSELSTRYRLQVDPTAPVERLSMGERQRIEILRALYHDCRIILMDEPTSVLTPMEVERLYELLVEMVERENRSIILTTHKIQEVLQISHRVTVLRRGRKVGTVDAKHLTPAGLVEMMIGTRPTTGGRAPSRTREPTAHAVPAIRLRNLVAGRAASGRPSVRGVSLEVRPGEILGIAGVEGNGQSELEAALAGLLVPSGGEIELPAGEVAYIPSERNRFGVVRTFSVAENLLLRQFASVPSLLPAPIFRPEVVEGLRGLVRRFEIYPPDLAALVAQLSGGNAQKVLLARELSRQPKAVLAAQPTMGLDVAAADFVRRQLRVMATAGAAVIIISSDLDELFDLCDRIAVMYAGEIRGVWASCAEYLPAIGAAMAGMQVDDVATQEEDNP